LRPTRVITSHYFAQHAGRSSASLRMLDAAPRVVVDPHDGAWSRRALGTDAIRTCGPSNATPIDIILDATELGGYRRAPAETLRRRVLGLEQASSARERRRSFAARSPWVTGAASGIGRAAAELLMLQGAAVVGLDPARRFAEHRPGVRRWLGFQCRRDRSRRVTGRDRSRDQVLSVASTLPSSTRAASPASQRSRCDFGSATWELVCGRAGH